MEEKVRSARLTIVISPLALRRSACAFIVLMFICALLLAWSALSHQESTLAIRPVNQGASVPDGFSVWHHLDANGIRFKSITPQDDVLLIKFDSRAQSAAAKVVLDRTLPRGYIIAQQEEVSQPAAWLSLIRDTSHRFG